MPVDPSPRPLVADVPVETLPVIQLRSPLPHPNIFRKRLHHVPHNVEPGSLVTVQTSDGTHVGFGFYNPASEIALRIVSRSESPPDEEFWDGLLRSAVNFRNETLRVDKSDSAIRVIHGEGDFLPGIVVDRYGDVLSAEAFSLAMFQRAPELIERLQAICQTKHWLIRPSPHSDQQEGFAADPLCSDGLPDSVVIHEFGTRFRVRFEGGHKTGFFCDQRENRRRLAELCEGKSVLDLCCYTGPFRRRHWEMPARSQASRLMKGRCSLLARTPI